MSAARVCDGCGKVSGLNGGTRALFKVRLPNGWREIAISDPFPPSAENAHTEWANIVEVCSLECAVVFAQQQLVKEQTQ